MAIGPDAENEQDVEIGLRVERGKKEFSGTIRLILPLDKCQVFISVAAKTPHHRGRQDIVGVSSHAKTEKYLIAVDHVIIESTESC